MKKYRWKILFMNSKLMCDNNNSIKLGSSSIGSQPNWVSWSSIDLSMWQERKGKREDDSSVSQRFFFTVLQVTDLIIEDVFRIIGYVTHIFHPSFLTFHPTLLLSALTIKDSCSPILCLISWSSYQIPRNKETSFSRRGTTLLTV